MPFVICHRYAVLSLRCWNHRMQRLYSELNYLCLCRLLLNELHFQCTNMIILPLLSWRNCLTSKLLRNEVSYSLEIRVISSRDWVECHMSDNDMLCCQVWRGVHCIYLYSNFFSYITIQLTMLLNSFDSHYSRSSRVNQYQISQSIPSLTVTPPSVSVSFLHSLQILAYSLCKCILLKSILATFYVPWLEVYHSSTQSLHFFTIELLASVISLQNVSWQLHCMQVLLSSNLLLLSKLLERVIYTRLQVFLDINNMDAKDTVCMRFFPQHWDCTC